jgi:hypothetical protein
LQEVMDELDLPDLLAQGAPEADHDVLGRIVRRHARRRLRRARIAASTAVVVALAGAGIGIGLVGTDHHILAAGRAPDPSATKVPAGLRWAKPSASQSVAVAGPGVFGWLAEGSVSTSSAKAGADERQSSTASPPAALVAPVPARYLPALCTRIGCGPFFPYESLTHLFGRSVGGLRIEASLGLYGLDTGMSPPETPFEGATGKAHSAAGSATRPAGAARSHPVPVALPCISPSELMVTVSQGRSTATLAVPGAASSRPFSVLASAEVDLDGTEVVLAVTHTSAAVRTVVSEFPGGSKDSMAPVDGWSVLVDRSNSGRAAGSAGAVILLARSGTGSTLEQATVPATGWLATPLTGTCRYWAVAPPPTASPVNSPPRSSGQASPTTATPG